MSEITGIHPYADKFPMLSDDELDQLAESISEVGLLHPVVVDDAGLVVDGRNRLAACERAGVAPVTELYGGDDVAGFVIASNVTRRNMSTGARAMATALVLEADGRRQEGRWERNSVYNGRSSVIESSTWTKALNQCGIVLDWQPDAADEVVRGLVSLDAAWKAADHIRTSEDREKIRAKEQAKREKTEAKELAERNAKIIADLTVAEQTKYLTLIEEGMEPQSAWAAYYQDTKKAREKEAYRVKIATDHFTATAISLRRVSGMLRNGESVATWMGGSDEHDCRSAYLPEYVVPDSLNDQFTISELKKARDVVDQFIEWSESR